MAQFPIKQRIIRGTHTIDATDQMIGGLLMGKNKPTYQRHIDAGDFVVIKNVGKLKTSGKKILQKEYFHFSGYPGGLKRKKLADVMKNNPGYALHHAVWNMLPKNKLRDQMIKRLRISK
jgi:large subunit ribosomal protein L13